MGSSIEYSLTIDTGDAASKLRQVADSLREVGTAGKSIQPPALPNVGTVQNATDAMNKLRGSFVSSGANAAVLSGLVGGLATALSSQLLSAVSSAIGAFKQFVSDGISFNATLQDAEISLAAVIRQFDQTGSIHNFSDAMAASRDVVEQLRQKAAESPATFQQLLAAFQGTAGAASAAGIPIGKQVTLITQLSQASSALGVTSDQLKQEVIALMSGNIDMNAVLAKTLGITGEMITQQKEQGTLYDFLMQKTAAFAEAGIVGAQSYSVALSNLHDNYDTLAGAVAQPLFAELTTDILSFNEALKDPDVLASIAVLGDVLSELYKQIKVIASALIVMTPGLELAKKLAEIVFGDAKNAKKQEIAGRQFGSQQKQLQEEIKAGVAPEKAQGIREQINKLFSNEDFSSLAGLGKMKESLLAMLEKNIREPGSAVSSPSSVSPVSPREQLQNVETGVNGRSSSESNGGEGNNYLKTISAWFSKAGQEVAQNVQKIADQAGPVPSATF